MIGYFIKKKNIVSGLNAATSWYEEVNRTDPSPSVRIPWFIPPQMID